MDLPIGGCSQTTLTRFWLFFDHLPPCVDIFYGMNVGKKWTFLDHLPTLYCKRSLWTTPKAGRKEIREMLRQAATAFCNLQVTNFLKVSKLFFSDCLQSFQGWPLEFLWHFIIQSMESIEPWFNLNLYNVKQNNPLILWKNQKKILATNIFHHYSWSEWTIW